MKFKDSEEGKIYNALWEAIGKTFGGGNNKSNLYYTPVVLTTEHGVIYNREYLLDVPKKTELDKIFDEWNKDNQ